MLKKSQEEKIIELRKKGYGYKSIASVLGLKRDTVRDLCRKHGLQGYLGYGLSVESEKVEIKEYPKNCLYCNKEINTEDKRGRKSKFCSDRCRREWWYENQDKKDRRETAWYDFICKYCGEDFKAYGNKNRKYCSPECARNHRHSSYKEKTEYEKRIERENTDDT